MIVLHQGNPVTFEDVYREYYSQVVGYLARKMESYQDAEDLAADIFEYAYKHFDGFDPQRASVRTWLFVIVDSRYKNYLRDHRSFEDIDDYADFQASDDAPMEQAMEMEDDRRLLAKLLGELSETQRKIIVYKYFKDMSAAEIGKKLNMSESNVRVQLFRTLKLLQKKIDT